MNYRHVFHAGNFADIFKHVVLTRILLHLNEKPQPYRVIDTHAGAGRYDLSGTLANKTGEWEGGIGRLWPQQDDVAPAPLLAPLLTEVAALNPSGTLRVYPGSPQVVLSLMRPQDRLIACELEPNAARSLSRNLANDKRARTVAADGYAALRAQLPPPERRGLVLIDPPFEDAGEFDRLADAVTAATRKWPTGIFAIWYPVKNADAAAFGRRIRALRLPKLLRLDFRIARTQPDRLTACGMLVVNPPWRLAEELSAGLPDLVNCLRSGPGAGFEVASS